MLEVSKAVQFAFAAIFGTLGIKLIFDGIREYKS